MNKELRALLWWRCEGYCEKCGIGLNRLAFAAHHRVLRAQGGKDEVTNLVALCHFCHNLGTRSIHSNPAQSYKEGWMVHNWQNPEDVLICTDAGLIIGLNTDGTKTNYKEQEVTQTWLENQP